MSHDASTTGPVHFKVNQRIFAPIVCEALSAERGGCERVSHILARNEGSGQQELDVVGAEHVLILG